MTSNSKTPKNTCIRVGHKNNEFCSCTDPMGEKGLKPEVLN